MFFFQISLTSLVLQKRKKTIKSNLDFSSTHHVLCKLFEISTVLCECRTSGKEKKGDLPEGFFDNPKVDAKVGSLVDMQCSEINLIG